ncbi:hypothetical protein K2F43_00890 [Clostridium estertheticum]|uniref:hypothetical protein n=1 Tax=Clostridium estertheticum TaxID=238834 RepID=UPI001C6F50CF|nr:hypothetical protein [Clostridium estertheticum]MBW9169757.1 hypothetical protein [Clostridium estertheticum]WLC74737.1 hypothetical protein KTC99_18575 [Clostridium estertheticum]
MKYSSKKEFLEVQNKLYDAMENILKENNIAKLNYKLVEQDIFFRPDKDIIINRRYTANINGWLQELKWLSGNIYEEMLLCLSYNNIYDKFDSPLRGSLKFVNRERYLKLTIYDLFTFREKLAFLMYEMFNRQIKIPTIKYVSINNKREKKEILKKLDKNEVSFDKINNGLKIIDISLENISWINNEEFKLIKDIMNQFSINEHVKILKQIRHPFTHRSNPGIDCFPMQSFEYKEVDESSRKMLLHMDEMSGIKDAKKLNYIVTSATPLEKQIKFDDAIVDVLATWELFVLGLKNLLRNVDILKQQVSGFY